MLRKFVSLGSILYLLFLIAEPCQDVFARTSDANGRVASSAAIQIPADAEPDSDNCSPFCICSCCSLSAVDHTFAVNTFHEVATAVEREALPQFGNIAGSSYQNSIWQPPKA